MLGGLGRGGCLPGGVGHVVRKRRPYRVAIAWELSKQDGGGCEGVHGISPGRVRSRNGDHVPTVEFSVQAAGQVYKQTTKFEHLGRSITDPHDISVEIMRQVQRVRGRYHSYRCELYDRPTADLRLKVRVLTIQPLKPSFIGVQRGTHQRLTRDSPEALSAGPLCTPTPLYQMAEPKPQRPHFVLSRHAGVSGV